MADVLRELGPLFLGSRLKRLAERLQAGALEIVRSADLPFQPAQLPLLAALERHGPMTISEAVDRLGLSQPAVTRIVSGLAGKGVIAVAREEADQRHKTLRLTREGEAAMRRARLLAWPRIEAAVRDLCGGDPTGLLQHIENLEDGLGEASLAERAPIAPDPTASPPGLWIREYSDDLAGAFHDINAEWIERMFTLEDVDRDIIAHPRERIVERGGAILFVEAADLGVIGTGALQPVGDGSFELVKMAVTPAAQGRKAGAFLLAALIRRARDMGIARLHLLTNRRCRAAIHLYEKLGFVHDEEIMRRYGARYARCDVAMAFRPAE